MYIGPNTLYRADKNLNYILDILIKVLLKAASGLAKLALVKKSRTKTNKILAFTSTYSDNI